MAHYTSPWYFSYALCNSVTYSLWSKTSPKSSQTLMMLALPYSPLCILDDVMSQNELTSFSLRQHTTVVYYYCNCLHSLGIRLCTSPLNNEQVSQVVNLSCFNHVLPFKHILKIFKFIKAFFKSCLQFFVERRCHETCLIQILLSEESKLTPEIIFRLLYRGCRSNRLTKNVHSTPPLTSELLAVELLFEIFLIANVMPGLLFSGCFRSHGEVLGQLHLRHREVHGVGWQSPGSDDS